VVGLAIALAITAGAVVLIVVSVLVFCGWLVMYTKSPEALRLVPPILRAMRDVVRFRPRP
jgi:hypothetical protein